MGLYESSNNNHDPQPVYESTNNKLLWDFKIQTDNKIEHNKPVLNEKEQKCLIIDVACPFWHLNERESWELTKTWGRSWKLMCLEIM